MFTVPIVSVGNSRGIRIPKKLLEELGSPETVGLDVRDGSLIVTPVAHARAGWDDPSAWRAANLDKDDQLWLDANLMDEAEE